MAHDRVVAVNEAYELPDVVVDTLVESTKFSDATGLQILTEDSPSNAAVKTLIAGELTEGESVNDALMAQVQADIGVEGGVSRASIEELINVLAIDDQIFIPATRFNLTTATPAIGAWPGAGFPSGWLMDAAAVEEVSVIETPIPPGWVTYEIFLTWVPAVAAAGNVMWRTQRYELLQGEQPQLRQTTTVAAAAGTAALGALREDVVMSNVVRVSGPLIFRIGRLGNDAGDTYASDAAFIGLRLVRSS